MYHSLPSQELLLSSSVRVEHQVLVICLSTSARSIYRQGRYLPFFKYRHRPISFSCLAYAFQDETFILTAQQTFILTVLRAAAPEHIVLTIQLRTTCDLFCLHHHAGRQEQPGANMK